MDGSPRALRVDPSYPLRSQLPPSQEDGRSSLTNGMARTTSRRRRPTGSGPPSRAPFDHFPQPPAPEVPKAPPVSYRPPNDAEHYGSSRSGYPSPSFAERARALTGNSISIPPSDPDLEPTPPPVKPVRRGSLNRPIGGVYSEIQQHKRDSYPPPNGPISPRRFSNPTSPQQYQAPNPYPPDRESKSAPNRDIPNRNLVTSSVPQASTRRASTGVPQPLKKEWAPDRSPLQKLEVKLSDISKEEKRARVQEAEHKLRDSLAGDTRRRSGPEGGSTLDRNSSGRGSVNISDMRQRGPRKTVDLPQSQRQYLPRSNIDKDNPSEPVPAEVSTIARSDNQRESLSAGSYPQRVSKKGRTEGEQPESVGHLSTNPVKALASSNLEQQPERGVRFQGQDGTGDVDPHPSEPDVLDMRNDRKSSVTEALARSDEGHNARRNKIHQNAQTMKSHSRSREVPPIQQELYKNRAERFHDDASAAIYGGSVDPISRHAVRTQDQASKDEMPPQRAFAAQARQVEGFGAAKQGAVDGSAHRKHHISDILHRGHEHISESHGQSGASPRHLDEWRRAGTARLTAADFGSENESEQDQHAWWEGRRSGSRRKGGRTSNKATRSFPEAQQNGTGKFNTIFASSRDRIREQAVDSVKFEVPHTRPYLGEVEYKRFEEASKSPLGNHVSLFLHRSAHDQTRGLTSAYSYSCPNLAIHDPSHESHICEPYLSKELTQSMRSIRIRPVPDLATFNPPLYLKCGPLLRYTGLRRDRLQTRSRSGGPSSIERETWRGSLMIVTADSDSVYDPAPTLRLFPEPMNILPAPSHNVDPNNLQDLPSEYIDPIAGLPKLSRSGKTVYVKPVDDLEHSKDLSQLENDDGLFEETRTAAVPTAYGTPDFRASSANPKPVKGEGRKSKKGQMVRGVRLHVERGVTFWRFNLEIELGAEQARIAYSINNSPSVGFWVPARGHSMNVMFHSCNGFSMSVKYELTHTNEKTEADFL